MKAYPPFRIGTEGWPIGINIVAGLQGFFAAVSVINKNAVPLGCIDALIKLMY